MEKDPMEKETLDALLRKAQGGVGAGRSGTVPFTALDPSEEAHDIGRSRHDLLKSIHLKVRAELGRTKLPLKDALHLGPGAIVDLDKFADDPVELFVGDLLVARGEVLVVNDSFCIRITEVFSQASGEEES